MKLSAAARKKKLKEIRLVLTDVDGVMTGGIIYHLVDPGTSELIEYKGIHSQDSIAMAWLAESGVPTGVISGRVSRGMDARLRMLKVKHIYQHRLDKVAVLREILAAEGLTAEQTLYVGDDIPDLPVLTRVGLGVAPANARPEAKAAAVWVTTRAGGDGAFREVTEELLKARGLWTAILERYR